MRALFIFSYCLLATTNYLFAQTTASIPNFGEIETQVVALAKQMHTDTSYQNRIGYAKEIEKILSEGLNAKGSYDHPFANLQGISMVQPTDKRFKIFTWELFVDKNTYQQFGIVQTKEGKVTVLEDKSHEMKQAEFSRLKHDNWYGAIYYNVQAFQVNNQTQYLLLGRDSYSYYERRKVVEIMYFDHTGKPKFGNNIIQVKDGFGRMRLVNRYFIQYSAAASVALRFDEQLQMVTFDHLVQGAPIEAGSPPSYLPDGSFNGLKNVAGRWDFVDMVFEYEPGNTLENATNPNEIMSRNEKKRDGTNDIFGRDTAKIKQKEKEKKKTVKHP